MCYDTMCATKKVILNQHAVALKFSGLWLFRLVRPLEAAFV